MSRTELIGFTEAGCALAKRLADALGEGCCVSGPERFAHALGIEAYKSLEDWTTCAFDAADELVFVGATGIAVRAIAPHVHDKFADPAVVCVDEFGRVTVPLLSGHVGGANDLARRVAQVTGGVAAVSTATDLNGVFAIDEFARDHDLAISDRQLAKRISAALLEGREVTFGDVPAAVDVHTCGKEANGGSGGVVDADTLRLVPRDVVVGIGCRRGTSCESLAAAVDRVLDCAKVDSLSVKGLASIDVKSDEAGLAQLSQDRSWPLSFFTAEELSQVEGSFDDSEFVRETVGVGNVCERAALAAAGLGAALIVHKEVLDGVTVALAQVHACRLCVVGLGPGGVRGMTTAAREAIEQCDLVVGYTAYVKLVQAAYPHKETRATGMRAELERCRMAFQEAAHGRTVALVCSGDAGVFGMASPCLELAPEFPQVEVEVIPGVTAASSGAALLGAPLGHDFVVVSLSDLLTSWEVIERRLDAAARADFCLCLYNPASRKRPNHLRKACDVLLRHRPPRTVCGLARNIDREGESSRVLTLGELRDAQADMFTTVFVGNSATCVVGGRMVTPRGYRRSEMLVVDGGSTPKSVRPKPAGARQAGAAYPTDAEVLVFGGTTEGREAATWLAETGHRTIVSSATEYGGSLVEGPGITSLVGRLDQASMNELMRSRPFACVIDATHPFAEEVSANISAAAGEVGLPYHRLVREQLELGEEALPSGESRIRACNDVQEAACLAAKAPGNVLLTTGTKDLAAFTAAMPDYAERLFVRILPVRDSLDSVLELGIPVSHIVAMQGPFSTELNEALINAFDIDLLVTKASGAVGGFQQKVDAARSHGVDVLVIGRPAEPSGLTFAQLKELFEEGGCA